MLWWDDDPKKALAAKVAEAARAYQHKFGRRPDTCYVAPETIAGGTQEVRLRLVPSVLVRPHHFWVGVEGREPASEAVAEERPASRRASSCGPYGLRPQSQPAALAS